jgi:hypothetical protein
LTPSAPKHTISPESSDGFASVGTILPKEKAAPLPGGLFMFCAAKFPSQTLFSLFCNQLHENSAVL